MTYEEYCLIVGDKEIEIYQLKKQVAALIQELQSLKSPAQQSAPTPLVG